jgi:6-phosphogluconate dehydrogenase
MIPADAIDGALDNWLKILPKGSIIIDGGNSDYRGDKARADKVITAGSTMLDIGTSGGVWGIINGFSMMAGGDKKSYQTILPVLDTLAAPRGGRQYFGEHGSGHYVKMVHNAIEYGMMEAIGEGYAVMEASDFNLDFKQVTKIYQTGTVIQSWLIDLAANIFESEDIKATSGVIGHLGEGEWTVNAGKELGVDVRVIEDALNVRIESEQKKNQQKFSNKIVALLRKQFGGHGISKTK